MAASLTQADITPEMARELIAQHGGVANAARAIAPKTGKSWRTVKEWIQLARDGKTDILAVANKGKLNRIAELLERSGIPLDAIGKISKVQLKAYGNTVKLRQKDGTHKVEQHGNWSTGIVLDPSWKEGPKWPVVQPAKPTIVKFNASAKPLRKVRSVVILSDLQVGFLNPTLGGDLVPLHDNAAIEVARQIVADIAPDELGYIGDVMDLSAQSRWTQHAEFARVTQPSLDEAHLIMAQFEAAAGKRKTRTFVIGGNHDTRLQLYVLKNAREAFGLRPAMATKGWPVFSVPYLLRLDDLGIDYIGEYPGSSKWLTPSLVVMHAPPKKFEMAASVIHGHTHRISRQSLAVHTHLGPQVFTIYDIGCLCKVGSYADPQSTLATSVPSDRPRVNWAQGIAVVEILEGKLPQHQVAQIHIENGRAIYAGKVYAGKSAA